MNERPAPRGFLRGADKQVDIAMRRGHKNGRGARALHNIEGDFIEAEKKISAGLGAARELLGVGEINA